jgi:hypothetical protein
MRTDDPNTNGFIDMTGQRFGELIALRPASAGPRAWWFTCDKGHKLQRTAAALRARARNGGFERCPVCRAEAKQAGNDHSLNPKDEP